MVDEQGKMHRSIEHEFGSIREVLASHEAQLSSIVALTEAKFVTYRALIDSQEQKVKLALDASEKAITKADIATEKAITKAEVATEKRFEGVNEFREQLREQANTFMTRAESTARWNSAIEKIESYANEHRRDMAAIREMVDRTTAAADLRLKALESNAANFQGRLWSLGAAIALVVVIVNVGIRFIA